MKKVLSNLLWCGAALLTASPAIAADVPSLYLIGDNVNGEKWTSGTNQMTYNETDGVYEWSGDLLASGFKINNGGWGDDTYNIGKSEDSGKLTFGIAFPLSASGQSKNIEFENGGTIVNPHVIFDYSKMEITVTGTETYFLVGFNVGNVSGWELNTNPMAYNETDKTYTWVGDLLGSGFKINNGTWDYQIGATSEDAVLNLGLTFPITDSDAKNINFNGINAIKDVKVVLSLENNNITVTGTEIEANQDIYMIGTMNGWEYWNSDYQLTKTENNIFTGIFNVPPVKENDGNQWFRFINLLGSQASENQIGPKDGEDVTVEFSEGEFSTQWGYNSEKSYMLQGWKGGQLSVTLDLNENNPTVVFEEVLPTQLYLIGEMQGWNEKSSDFIIPKKTYGVYEATFNLPQTYGKQYFRFCTEMGSWAIVNSNSIGASEDAFDVSFTKGNFEDNIIIPSENNWILENWSGGELTLTIDIVNNTASFTTDEDYEPLPLPEPDGKNIYLIGNMQGWNYLDGKYALTLDDTGDNYVGTFDLAASESQMWFRFYQALADYDDYAIGAATDGLIVEFEEGTFTSDAISPSKNNWMLSYWPGGEITMAVSKDFSKVVFTTEVEFVNPEPAWVIVGSFTNNWNLNNAIALEEGADGIWSATVPELKPSFKIVDKTIGWDSQLGISTPVEANTEYILVGKDNGEDAPNITFAGLIQQINNALVTFDPETSAFEIVAKSSDIIIEYPTLYATGSFCDWPSPGEGASVLGQEKDGVYTFNLDLGNSGNVSFKLGTENWGVEVAGPTKGVNVGIQKVTVSLKGDDLTTTLTGEQTLMFDYDNLQMWFVEKTSNEPGTNEPSGDDDNTGSVNSLEQDGQEVIFNLQGVRVDRNKLTKGIYIINGKKVLVK